MNAPAAQPVLILRTVSVEKLDAVLAACRARWPQTPLAVASGANRRVELLTDARVAEVVDVAIDANGFPPDLGLSRAFTAVVIPLGNERGSGYANILHTARRCRAAEYFVMPYALALQPVSRLGLAWRATVESLLLALSLAPAWCAAAWITRR